jgi:uncharacterized protein (TIGR03086 family)
VAGLIALVGPEQLDAPTPCTDYDVRSLLAHVVGGCERWALLGEGGGGLALKPMVSGVPDDAWTAAYDEASGRVVKAWASDERMAAEGAVPWGSAPGSVALSGYVLETVTHSWDLARALGGGAAVGLDEELAEFAFAFARKGVPAERRGGRAPFAEVREVAQDASVYDRLAGWLGREPHWVAA